jgi:shikimate dehydrogenase
LGFELAKFFEDAPAGRERFAVIGWPLGHTLSPAIHNAAFAARNVPAVYRAVPLKTQEWSEFVMQARDALAGFNVTLPYKEWVVTASDIGSDFLVPLTRAANTVEVTDRRFRCFNTDGDGFLKDAADNGIPLTGKKVVLLGAGGSASAILGALYKEGVRPAKVTVVNRGEERLAGLLSHFDKVMDGEFNASSLVVSRTRNFARFPIEPVGDRDSAAKAVRAADVLVNAASAGLAPGEKHDLLDLDALHGGLAVYDLIYHHETALLRAARAAGAKAVGGLGMLVHQAAAAFKIWFPDKEPPVREMFSAAKSELERRGK